MKDRIKKALKDFNHIQERVVVHGFSKPGYGGEAIRHLDDLVDTFEYFANLRDTKNFNDEILNYKIAELLMDNDEMGGEMMPNLRDKMVELNTYLEELDDKVIAPPVKGFQQQKDR